MKTLISTLILGAGLVLGGCGNEKKEIKEIPKKEIIGTIIAEYESREYTDLSKNPQLIKKKNSYGLATENNDTFRISPIFTSEDIFNIGDKVKLLTEENEKKTITINNDGEAIPSLPYLNIVSYEILNKKLK